MEKSAKGRGEIGEEAVRIEVVVACLAENPEHSQRGLVSPHYCGLLVHDEGGIATSPITGRFIAADGIVMRSCSVPGTEFRCNGLVSPASYCLLSMMR